MKRASAYAALLVLTWVAAPSAAQTPTLCTEPNGIKSIELVPCERPGNTKQAPEHEEFDYDSGPCTLPDAYGGREDVYKVQLYKGNRVGFRVTPAIGVDLVLALFKDNVCVAHSIDNVGSRPEEILPRGDLEGPYLLVVDAVGDEGLDRGGFYKLEVLGTNPVPDVALSLPKDREAWVAGTAIDFKLGVRNHGELAASGVAVTLRLPPGVSALFPLPEDCQRSGPREVKCTFLTLPVSQVPREVPLRLFLNAAERGNDDGKLLLEGTVKSNEADPDDRDNHDSHKMAVHTEVDLELQTTAALSPTAPAGCLAVPGEPLKAVAGCELDYSFEIINNGRSNATKVELTVAVPAGTSFVSAARCQPVVSKKIVTSIRCQLGTLQFTKSVSRHLRVMVKPNARDPLVLSPRVKADEPDPADKDPDPILVRAVVNLSVEKSSPASVVAGNYLTYSFAVRNAGPSQATQVRICDPLPPELTFVGSSECRLVESTDCQDQLGLKESAQVVRCEVGNVAPGGSMHPSFTAKVAPNASTPLRNRASVRGQETDGASGSSEVETTVTVEADLDLDATVEPDPVAAGDNVLLTLTVTNRGPSQFFNRMVQISLTPDPSHDLAFVSSPDRCSPLSDTKLLCRLPTLRVGDEWNFSVVLEVAASEEHPFLLTAKLAPHDDDLNSDNNEDPAPVNVVRRADLAITQAGDPDPVVPAFKVNYNLAVTNRGPSDAESVEISICLPEGFSPDLAGAFSATKCGPVTKLLWAEAAAVDQVSTGTGPAGCPPDRLLVCSVLDGLSPGQVKDIPVKLEAGQQGGIFSIPAMIASTMDELPDPNPADNQAVTEITVAKAEDADLEVTLESSANPVVVGDTFTYTLTVRNRGIATLKPEVTATATLCLPPGVCKADATTLDGCAVVDLPVPCEFDAALPPGQQLTFSDLSPDVELDRKLAQPVKVRVRALDPFLTRGSLTALAHVRAVSKPGAEPPSDPNHGNDHFSLHTNVLAVAPLVLPFFSVLPSVDGSDSAFEATSLAIRNNEDDPLANHLELELEHLRGEDGPRCTDLPSLTLLPSGLQPLDLKDVCQPNPPLRPQGALAVAPIDTSALSPLTLSGVFRRAFGSTVATGNGLVRTSTEANPRELCRRWDVPLLQGTGLANSTDFAFFVPETFGLGDPEILGRVYTTRGKFVQTVTVPIPPGAQAFERSAGDLGLLLAGSGWVEWELPAPIVGNVSATFRPGDGSSGDGAAVPGFCAPDPRTVSAAEKPNVTKQLVLPFFVSVADGSLNPTAIVALHNGSDNPINLVMELSLFPTANGKPKVETSISLAAHGSSLLVVSRVLEEADPNLPGLFDGYAVVRGAPDDEAAGDDLAGLSGVYLRTGGGAGRVVAEALVAAENTGGRSELCKKWSVPLGGMLGEETHLIVYWEPPDTSPPQSLKVELFGSNGDGPTVVDVTEKQRPFQTSLCTGVGSERACPDEGSVVVDLTPLSGHVTALHLKDDGPATLVAGTCLDHLD